MKNILVIMHMCPFPMNTGGNQAVINGLKAISKKNNVILLYPSNRNKRSKFIENQLKQLLNIEIKPFYRNVTKSGLIFYKYLYQKISNRLLHNNTDYLVERQMNLCNNIITYDFINYINQVIEDNDIDIVQIEFVPFMSLVNALVNKKVKKVFVHHELRFVRNQLVLKGIEKHKNYFSYLYENLKNQEIAILNKYDAIITLSETDKSKLEMYGVNKPIYSSFAIVSSKSQDWVYAKYRLTFLGPGMHDPNFEGIKWFLSVVWPLLLEYDNNYTLDIIGKWDIEKRNKLGNYKNVRFLGFVDNIADSLKGSIMIVPINIGSGIRMKILEAAQCQIPIVTTSVGCEGLPLADNENCLIGNNSKEFTNKIIQMSDFEFQKKIVNNAYRTIVNKYSLEKLTESREMILNNL